MGHRHRRWHLGRAARTSAGPPLAAGRLRGRLRAPFFALISPAAKGRTGNRAERVVDYSPKIEAARRRITQHAMRMVFRKKEDLACIAARLPRTGIHRILVCRTVHTLGDSLTLTPLLQELSAIYPGPEIDIVGSCPAAREIYGAFFCVGKIIQLPAHALRYPLRTLGALQQMKRTHYDLVIDPDPQSQSGR